MNRALPLLVLVVQCTPIPGVPRPGPRPVLRPAEADAVAVEIAPSGVLSLAQARRLALANHPEIAARRASARARRSELDQAHALPNPELEVSAEDLGVGDRGLDAESMQVTATLLQPIELGGERSARMAVAAERLRGSELEVEAERLRIYRDVSKAFVDLLAAQRRGANAGAMVAIAENTMRVLRAKSEAGRASDLEVQQNRVALALARIEERKAREARESARLVLTTLLGPEAPAFEWARGGFAIPTEVPALDRLLPSLGEHPELLRRRARVEERRAQLAAEQATAIPNLEVGIGYRRINEGDRDALLATIGIPLPLLDRNAGRIDAAQHEIDSAESGVAAGELELRRQLEVALRRLSAAHYEVTTLAGEVLAEARASYQAVAAGYALGRFGYLELLDAQRTLFAAAQHSVEARASFFKAAVDLEALAGEPLLDWTEGREPEKSELGWQRALGKTPPPNEVDR